MDYNRRLVIHNVQPEDEGEYICTVTADQASAESIKSVTLSIGGTFVMLLDFCFEKLYTGLV